MTPKYKPSLHHPYQNARHSEDRINTTAPLPPLQPVLPPFPDPFRTTLSSNTTSYPTHRHSLTINHSHIPSNLPAQELIEKELFTVSPRTPPVSFSVPTLKRSHSKPLLSSHLQTGPLPSVTSILPSLFTARNYTQHPPQRQIIGPNDFEGNTTDVLQGGNLQTLDMLPKTDFIQDENKSHAPLKESFQLENPSSQMRESGAEQFLPSISQAMTQTSPELIPQPFPRHLSPHQNVQSHIYHPSDSALEQIHMAQTPMIPSMIPSSHPADVYHSRDFDRINSSQAIPQVTRSHQQYYQEAQRYSDSQYQNHQYAQIERNYPRGYATYQADYGDSPLHQVAQIGQNGASQVVPSSHHLPSMDNIETGQGHEINNCLPPLTGAIGGRNMHESNLYPYPTRARPDLLPVYRAVGENNIGATTTPITGYDSIRGGEVERISRAPGMRTTDAGRISKRRSMGHRKQLRTRVEHLSEIESRVSGEPLNEHIPDGGTADEVAAGRTMNGMVNVEELEGMIHGRRQHECPECDLTFRDVKSRDMHFRNAHSRRYACEHCNAAFKTRSDMNRHVRIVHEKQRNFPCEQCNSKFSERNKLKRHVQTVHEKLRPYFCPICHSGFGEIGNLRQHANSIHPGVDIDTNAIKREAQRKSDRQLVS